MHKYRVVVLALLISLCVGCGKDHGQSVSAAPPSPTQPEQSLGEGIAKKPPSDTYVTSGPIVVENQVDVDARRAGLVAKILVDVGTVVRKGQLLALLDDRQIAAERDAAAAKTRSLEANIKNWEAETQVFQADLRRAEGMWEAQLITKEQLEHARYKVIGDEYEVRREQELLQQSRATMRSLELELEKTRIRTPFEGVIARRYVRAGQNVAVGEHLFWVTATSPLNVKFTLPEGLIAKIRPGEEVKVNAPAIPDERHTARVTLVSPVVDPSSGTIEVQARLLGPTGHLRAGMTVDVSVKEQ